MEIGSSSRLPGHTPPEETRQPKKRTKTGCQTCRRRRIKCDEGKPVCEKCRKGNRNCTYGKTEVKFKDSYQNPDSSFTDDPSFALNNPQLAEAQRGGPSAQGHSLAAIAPKPPGQIQDRFGPRTQRAVHDQQLAEAQRMQGLLASAGAALPGSEQYDLQSHYRRIGFDPFLGLQQDAGSSSQAPYPGDTRGLRSGMGPSQGLQIEPDFSSLQQPSYEFAQPQLFASQDVHQEPNPLQSLHPHPFDSIGLGGTSLGHHVAPGPSFDMLPDDNEAMSMILDLPGDAMESLELSLLLSNSTYDATTASQSATALPSYQPRPHHHTAGQTSCVPFSRPPPTLFQYSEPVYTTQFNWNQEQALTADPIDSLNLFSESARDFMNQFIHTTGPSISMYERVTFRTPGGVQLTPGMGRSLWNWTLPLLATQNPCLHHAVMALSCLSLAKRDNGSRELWESIAARECISFSRSLTTVIKASTAEMSPQTIAACLLAGYYDIWRGSQRAWCIHLGRAGAMLQQANLKEKSRRCLPARISRQSLAGHQPMSTPSLRGWSIPSLDPIYQTDSVDHMVLEQITGFKTTPETYGLGLPLSVPSGTSEKDIEDYETLRDLFWWYCKMDAYQSMLGGSKLYMMYKNWIDCPPRGRIGRLDQLYGTYDHLVLLLGRIADFGARDQKRRLKIFRNSKSNRSPGPPGLMANASVIQTGHLFPEHINQQRRQEEEAAESRTEAEALKEWYQISHAFDWFFRLLGHSFRSHLPGSSTPFGPAKHYASYEIAGIWMNYHMGKILLHRHHPGMPYAALEATVRAFPHTEIHAMSIAQIAAGIAGDLTNVEAVDSHTSAALIEMTFCLFLAAPQFREANQKQWMLDTMERISDVVGWRSASEIAGGCETLWTHLPLVDPSLPPYQPSGRSRRRVAPGTPFERRLDKAFQESLIFARHDKAEAAMGLLGLAEDFNKIEIVDN